MELLIFYNLGMKLVVKDTQELDFSFGHCDLGYRTILKGYVVDYQDVEAKDKISVFGSF